MSSTVPLYCSRFAADYLPKLSPDQLDQYDDIINTPDDDWRLYYWITGETSLHLHSNWLLVRQLSALDRA